MTPLLPRRMPARQQGKPLRKGMRTGRARIKSSLPSRNARRIALLAALWLAGCYGIGNERIAQTAKSPANENTAHGSGHVTVASWYGPGFIGHRTASGEVYRPDDLTAASRSLPLGTRVQVTNLNTGKSVVVRVDDRGPYSRTRDRSFAACGRGHRAQSYRYRTSCGDETRWHCVVGVT
jgi:hypothetical protein